MVEKEGDKLLLSIIYDCQLFCTSLQANFLVYDLKYLYWMISDLPDDLKYLSLKQNEEYRG